MKQSLWDGKIETTEVKTNSCSLTPTIAFHTLSFNLMLLSYASIGRNTATKKLFSGVQVVTDRENKISLLDVIKRA